jgi:hypothetical protein
VFAALGVEQADPAGVELQPSHAQALTESVI